MVFDATWRQHGGSGSGLTVAEALKLDVPRLRWWAEQVEAEREREHAALKEAAKKARGRGR